MGFVTVALKLAQKGFKPTVNIAEKSLTYTSKYGVQNRLLFGEGGKIKFWQSIDFTTGQMKVYENITNQADKRISKLLDFARHDAKQVNTKTFTTDFQKGIQTVQSENNLTGEISVTTYNMKGKAVSQPAASNETISSTHKTSETTSVIAADIFKDGERIVYEPVNLKVNNVSSLEYNMKKSYIVEDGPWGKRVQVAYNVTDEAGKRVGAFDGIINLGNGQFYGHGIQTFRRGIGLGRYMKQLIKQDAKAYNCSKIDIDAAYGSHMFHNKMGYKCDIGRIEEGKNAAIRAFDAIKKTRKMPEFEQKINQVKENGNSEEMSKLLDEIFTSANTKKINSQDLGIVGIQIPMTYNLA